ncbi:MAG: hypothetical protein HAW67_06120 [Endozoicomonadaceae bacterium]|nr:hypothetical protein [Endozoicomonadaceae bacterium]
MKFDSLNDYAQNPLDGEQISTLLSLAMKQLDFVNRTMKTLNYILVFGILGWLCSYLYFSELTIEQNISNLDATDFILYICRYLAILIVSHHLSTYYSRFKYKLLIVQKHNYTSPIFNFTFTSLRTIEDNAS